MKLIYEHRTPQSNNTCVGCNQLVVIESDSEGTQYKCNKYTAMENMVRCIEYDDVPVLDWINYIYI